MKRQFLDNWTFHFFYRNRRTLKIFNPSFEILNWIGLPKQLNPLLRSWPFQVLSFVSGVHYRIWPEGNGAAIHNLAKQTQYYFAKRLTVMETCIITLENCLFNQWFESYRRWENWNQNSFLEGVHQKKNHLRPQTIVSYRLTNMT